MTQPFTIDHLFKNECLGSKYKVAVQSNFHDDNIISTIYYKNDFGLFLDDSDVAIFRLKPKVKCDIQTQADVVKKATEKAMRSKETALKFLTDAGILKDEVEKVK